MALVNSYYWPDEVGGAEVVVRHLARGLMLSGIEVRIFTTGMTGEVQTFDGVAVQKLKQRNVYFPPAGRPPLAKRLLWHTRELLSSDMAGDLASALLAWQPDLIHFHNTAGFSLSAQRRVHERLPATPLVQTMHDFAARCARGVGTSRSGKPCEQVHPFCYVRRPVALRSLSYLSAIVTPSRFLARWFDARRGLPVPVRFIPNGIPARKRVSSRQKVRPTFIYVGQLVEHKGLLTLARAAKLLPAEAFDLHLVGTGPLLSRIRGMLPGAFVHGRVTEEEKWDLLNAADALILPSQWPENAPVVLAEAMQAGLALIGSNIGGIPEFIDPGANGLLIPAGDSQALACAMNRLLTAPEEMNRYKAESRARALTYDISTMVESYASLYYEFVSPRGQHDC